MTFVDTSAPLAFLDRDAASHAPMVASLAPVLADGSGVTHNYVVLEAEALAHRRLGGPVARRLLPDVVPLLDVVWVQPALYAAAVCAHVAGSRRRASPVDRVSFEAMRRRGPEVALALDDGFATAGSRLLP